MFAANFNRLRLTSLKKRLVNDFYLNLYAASMLRFCIRFHFGPFIIKCRGNYFIFGQWLCTVGRIVASDIRGPGSNTAICNTYKELLLTVNCWKDEYKEKEAVKGSKNYFICTIYLKCEHHFIKYLVQTICDFLTYLPICDCSTDVFQLKYYRQFSPCHFWN